jgi:hypothetical protein
MLVKPRCREISVIRKEHFVEAMEAFKHHMSNQETKYKCQEINKLKLIELTDCLMSKDIYEGDYVNEDKLRPKRQALYRICQNIGECFYKSEHMGNLSFFVLIFLGVPYESWEEKKPEQMSLFDI